MVRSSFAVVVVAAALVLCALSCGALVGAQRFTTTTAAQFNMSLLPQQCQNCNFSCVPTAKPIDAETVFRVNTTNFRFSRYNFRIALGNWLGLNSYSILDHEITPTSYAFKFAPVAVTNQAATGLTEAKVCGISPGLLITYFTCCMHNVTKFVPTVSAEDAAESARKSHQTKLIVCWVILGVTTIYIVTMMRKDSSTKDYALESAKDLAEQRDDDEE